MFISLFSAVTVNLTLRSLSACRCYPQVVPGDGRGVTDSTAGAVSFHCGQRQAKREDSSWSRFLRGLRYGQIFMNYGRLAVHNK